jgi:hypothetical protein
VFIIGGVSVTPGVFLRVGEAPISNLYARAVELGAVTGEKAYWELWRKRRKVSNDWRCYTFLIPTEQGIWIVRYGGMEWHRSFDTTGREFGADCRLLFPREQFVPQHVAWV